MAAAAAAKPSCAAAEGGGTGGEETALPLNAGEEADYAPVEPVDPALLGWLTRAPSSA